MRLSAEKSRRNVGRGNFAVPVECSPYTLGPLAQATGAWLTSRILLYSENRWISLLNA